MRTPDFFLAICLQRCLWRFLLVTCIANLRLVLPQWNLCWTYMYSSLNSCSLILVIAHCLMPISCSISLPQCILVTVDLRSFGSLVNFSYACLSWIRRRFIILFFRVWIMDLGQVFEFMDQDSFKQFGYVLQSFVVLESGFGC